MDRANATMAVAHDHTAYLHRSTAAYYTNLADGQTNTPQARAARFDINKVGWRTIAQRTSFADSIAQTIETERELNGPYGSAADRRRRLPQLSAENHQILDRLAESGDDDAAPPG
jgi:hypothetical protein